jgi:antitoxin component HigA of HigAB toxin-antitoxin module
MKKGSCHHCGTALEFVEKVFRNDTCPDCGSDVYCCLNCSNYDESAPNQCSEPQAEKESVKDRRNYCDYFTLREGPASSRGAQKAAEARRKLDALFKK